MLLGYIAYLYTPVARLATGNDRGLGTVNQLWPSWCEGKLRRINTNGIDSTRNDNPRGHDALELDMRQASLLVHIIVTVSMYSIIRYILRQGH